MGDGDSQKLKLTEFLFKLQVDPEYLKRYMDDSQRESVVDEWDFSDEVRQVLLNMDHEGLKQHLNPIVLPVLGWIKSPAGS